MLSANIISKKSGVVILRLWSAWLILACMGGLFASCHSDKSTEKTVVSDSRKGPTPEEATNIESYMSEAAKVKGKLTAPYMQRYQRSDTPYAEFPRTLHIDFYNDSMHIESQLDAKYGKYFQSLSKVFLRDSVVFKNIINGDTLHCKELWWDQQTQRFTTDKPVEIYTRDKILFGTGMDADQNFRNYNIKHLSGTTLYKEGGIIK